eukprot:m51a1_g3699 hypothetical protein (316) ;mRNA; f:388059-389463
MDPSGESSEPAWWSPSVTSANIVMASVESLVLAVALVQLLRITRRASLLHRQFTAKKVFHVLLAAVMLLRISWTVFFCVSPCFTKGGGVPNWCSVLDYLWEDVASTAFFFCYLTTMLFWAEFVHVLKTRSEGDFNRIVVLPLVIAGALALGATCFYVVLVLVWAGNNQSRQWRLGQVTILFFSAMYVVTGVSLAWFGVQVTVHVHSHRQPLRTSLRILVVALTCSILLLARSVWNISNVVWGTTRGSNDWAAWKLCVYDSLFEITPSCLMLALMWPLPSVPKYVAVPTNSTYGAAVPSSPRDSPRSPLLARQFSP